MSDESQQSPQDDVAKWGDLLDWLSQEGKDELARRLWDWKPEMAAKQRLGPFARKKLTGLEVFWLAARTWEALLEAVGQAIAAITPYTVAA